VARAWQDSPAQGDLWGVQVADNLAKLEARRSFRTGTARIFPRRVRERMPAELRELPRGRYVLAVCIEDAVIGAHFRRSPDLIADD
jgi:hypothetical protein